MPLVQAKCTNCGANIEVDNTRDAAVCPYCGTAYVVEKAINNYNVTNNISAGVVNVYGGNSADFVIRAGTLEKYNGASTDVVIPNSVTSIGRSAFEGCRGLTSVVIPDSVTSIGDSVFYQCSNLTSIVIPDSVASIGAWAFCDCSSLTSVVIPDSVTSIDGLAFYGCDHLTIHASVAWKTRNYDCHWSLREYMPQPKPQPQPEKSSGCYVATAVYGSYDCPAVWTLRRYRDHTLARSPVGRLFIRCYYAVSPTVVRMFGGQKWFNRFWRKRLDKFVDRLQSAGYDDSPYTDKT